MLSNLRHFFLPHHTNNFKAKALHSQIIGIYIVLFLILGISFKFIHLMQPDILGFATDIYVDQLVTFTNQKRIENGLAPLKYNAQLSQAAAKKAADMFAKDYWAHTAPDGKTPWDFINGVGYVYTVAGENLAKNFDTSENVVNAWMNSPSHRENLLRSSYEDVGFAIVNGRLGGEDTTLVVQMFGTHLASAPTPQVALTPNQFVGTVQAQNIQAKATPAPNSPLSVDTELPAQKTMAQSPTTSWFSQPVFTFSKFPKQLPILLFGSLAIILLIDAFYVWKNRIVRIAGKTAAHLLFLLTLTGIIGILSLGSIL